MVLIEQENGEKFFYLESFDFFSSALVQELVAFLKNYKMSKGISKNVVRESCEKKLLERLINFILFHCGSVHTLTDFDTIRNQIFNVLKLC